jgi:hypothetical protein
MMTIRNRALASLMSAMGIASPVQAGLVHYVVTSPIGLPSLSFSLDDTPTPDAFAANFFQVIAPPGTFDPAGSFGGPAPVAQITFYTDAGTAGEPGGMAFSGLGTLLFGAAGPQLFTGPTSAPTLTLGTFSLAIAAQTMEGRFEIITPNAYRVLAFVPEPASWALMIGGFAAIGGILRRRLVRVAFA